MDAVLPSTARHLPTRLLSKFVCLPMWSGLNSFAHSLYFDSIVDDFLSAGGYQSSGSARPPWQFLETFTAHRTPSFSKPPIVSVFSTAPTRRTVCPQRFGVRACRRAFLPMKSLVSALEARSSRHLWIANGLREHACGDLLPPIPCWR